jgi:hypothetical protein
MPESISILNEDGSVNTDFILNQIGPLARRSPSSVLIHMNAGILALVACTNRLHTVLKEILEKMPPQGGQ